MARATMAAGEGKPAHGDEDRKRGFEIGNDNPWKLESSDQPGMVLISAVMTGNNYHFWSRFMSIALEAKGKLGFVNGEIKAPEKHSPKYRQWKQTDCMVFCWILNSLSKEITNASIYADTAKGLWDELEQIYGGWNGAMAAVKAQEMRNLKQGSDSVTVYYRKFEKLSNEIGNLKPGPRDVTLKLFQFLDGLNDSFHVMRHKLLAKNPLPSVYSAYSKILVVEDKQFDDETDEYDADVKVQGREQRKSRCDHCNDPGHEMSNCFKLHGYPDWYKNPKERIRDFVSKRPRY